LFRRVIGAGLIAGLAAGLVLTVVHVVRLDPLIAAAETYETAEPHAHGQAAVWEPTGLERPVFTVLANLVIGAGFGLILSGAFALRQASSGRGPDAREGLLWGMAGFAAFALAPAAGLPPVPPGMAEAGIYARQAWWLATAGATAAGLALAVFPRSVPWRIAGALLILAPHVVGAPVPPAGADAVPAKLAAAFTALSLVAAALFWATLGLLGGFLYQAFGEKR
jgi:cobalt transporter subunit CbtA